MATRRAATALIVALAGPSGCGLAELGDDADVGDAPQCEAARTWPVAFTEAEEDLVRLIADLRDSGGECDEAELSGVGDLELDPALRCAARLDATVRVENDDIDQNSGAVASAFTRVNLAGYEGIVRHQLIAADYFEAATLFDAWLGSPEHCEAMLDDNLAHIGIGHSRTGNDDGAVWVVFTGEERD